jgi:hypothetical protein
MKEKSSFLLHHDTLGVIEELTDQQAGQLIKEIYKISISLNNPDIPVEPSGLEGLMNSVLHPFRAQLLRDYDKYVGVCARNKSNGGKGGRPKEPTGPQTNPNEPDKDKDSDKEKENGSDKGKGNAIVKSKPTKVALKHSDEDIDLARTWGKSVTERSPSFKLKAEHGPKWANEIRLMRERDGRSVDEIAKFMDGVHKDPFWSENIFDVKKLREQINKGALDKLVKTEANNDNLIAQMAKEIQDGI